MSVFTKHGIYDTTVNKYMKYVLTNWIFISII